MNKQLLILEELLDVREILHGLESHPITKQETNNGLEYINRSINKLISEIGKLEEPKYCIMLPRIVDNWRFVAIGRSHWGVRVHYTDNPNDVPKFTAHEILEIDPRYFVFAVPAGEVEKL